MTPTCTTCAHLTHLYYWVWCRGHIKHLPSCTLLPPQGPLSAGGREDDDGSKAALGHLRQPPPGDFSPDGSVSTWFRIRPHSPSIIDVDERSDKGTVCIIPYLLEPSIPSHLPPSTYEVSFKVAALYRCRRLRT